MVEQKLNSLNRSHSEAKHSFTAYQQKTGYFTASQYQLTIYFFEDSQELRIEDGVASKISRRAFKVNEVYQILSYSVPNTNKSQVGKVKGISFVFKDKKFQEVSCVVDKQEFLRFEKVIRSTVDFSERMHLFFQKQQLSRQQKQLCLDPQGRRISVIGRNNSQKWSTEQNQGPTQIIRLAETDEQMGVLQYTVTIRESNLKSKNSSQAILVGRNVADGEIFIEIVNSKQSFQLISWYRADQSDGRRIVVKIKSNQIWYLDFQNTYKAFQFQEQVRLFQFSDIFAEQIDHKLFTRQYNCQVLQELVQMNVIIPIRAFVVTYNMARVQQYIQFQKLIPNPQDFNIIVWGTQECVMNLKEAEIGKLRNYLGEDFVQIGLNEMWEMFIVVFARQKDAKFVTNVETNYVANGVMNYIGNKGALLLQFNLYDRLFTFVNCHLFSGVEKREKRLEQLNQIQKNISCRKNDKIEPDILADFCFLMGDLNQRFKSTYHEHIDKVNKSAECIKELDELYEARVIKEHYYGYHEEKINFLPTYKRSSISSTGYVNKKDQCPSYTDRILLKQNDTSCTVNYNDYNSREEILGSDHRPVFLDLQINIKPKQFMNSQRLLDFSQNEQGFGKIIFTHFQLQLKTNRLAAIKRKLIYPINVQLQFKSEWLCASPYSFEKTIKETKDQSLVKFWKDIQLPTLFTPINSCQVLRDKRLLIIVKLCEGTNLSQENFAYCTLIFQEMEQLSHSQYVQTYRGPLVGDNSLLGDFDCTLVFSEEKSKQSSIEDTPASENDSDQVESDDNHIQGEVPELQVNSIHQMYYV